MSTVALSDDISTRGLVQWIVRDSRGRFVRHGRCKNKTNNNALQALAQWGIGIPNVNGTGVVPYPTQMQLGTGTGTPSATDPGNGLFTPATGTLIAINNFSVYQLVYAQYVAFWGSSTPPGNYTEAVLLDPNNLCWAHVLLQTSASQPYVPIQAGQTLTIQWKLQLLGN